jgi:endonuclease/exonuclease/phosphatase family metal-dependent hydrolase
MAAQRVRSVKLIQLNTWGGKLQFQILDFLKSERPDIVCMQEVHDLKGPSGAVFATLDEIKEAGGFEFGFMSPTRSFQYQQRKNSFGNATLSRLKILKAETVFTHGKFKDNFDLTKHDFNSRNFQHLILQSGKRRINVLNHHGYLVLGTKDGNHETARQMEVIADYISKLSGPLILAGDFNLTPRCDSIKVLNRQLLNLSAKYRIKSTFNQFNSNDVVCDYIFVNDFVKVRNFKVSDELVSDHKALILEFDI